MRLLLFTFFFFFTTAAGAFFPANIVKNMKIVTIHAYMYRHKSISEVDFRSLLLKFREKQSHGRVLSGQLECLVSSWRTPRDGFGSLRALWGSPWGCWEHAGGAWAVLRGSLVEVPGDSLGSLEVLREFCGGSWVGVGER